jgi:hypothetical protein
MRVPFRAIVCLLPLLLGAAPLVAAPGDFGRQKLEIPGAVEDGVWDGTWYHVSRDHRVALWMRTTDDGRPELRLRYLRMGSPAEQFDTNWAGRVEYDVQGAPAEFALTLTEGDKDGLRADWFWDLQFASSGRTEEGVVTIYRSGDGRKLVFLFDPWERRLRRGEQVQAIPQSMTWTFIKASKRLVLWDELPF